MPQFKVKLVEARELHEETGQPFLSCIMQLRNFDYDKAKENLLRLNSNDRSRNEKCETEESPPTTR